MQAEVSHTTYFQGDAKATEVEVAQMAMSPRVTLAQCPLSIARRASALA